MDISTLTLGDSINVIEQNLKTGLTPVLSPADKLKIETNHNFIKKILSLYQLIDKTDDFVKDIQHVNDKIINRKYFPGSYRCPTLTNLKTFISSMVNSAINQKNKQIFYRAIEYLHTFKSIIVPSKTGSDFSKPAPLFPFKLVLFALSNEVL